MSTDSWTDGQADWTVKMNWSEGTVPGATDDVIVDNNGATMANPIVRSSVPTIQSLAVGPATGADTAQVTIGAGGTLNVAGDVTQRGVLTVSAAGSLNIGGTFNDVNGNVSVVGTLTAANVILGGDPAVGSGEQLFLSDGTINAPVTVMNGLSLSGRGTITGAVTIESGGFINARPSATAAADPLKTGSLNLETGSTMRAQLTGADAGQFSLEQVTGSVTLGGALKIVDFGFTATPGSTFEIVDNDGTDAINGTYEGLAEGASLTGTKNAYTISYVGGDGNDIVLTATGAACFATGTRIRTMQGDVAVEHLQPGDVAITASGVLRRIVWIGHREMHCADLATPSDFWPVRIRAGAFGCAMPERDLYLSPGHPVLVGDYLVPVMCLINGTSIAKVPVESVTYWHVELDAHDILLADGLPAESYLDWGDRAFFEEAADHVLINPDLVVPGLGARCRPVAIDGPTVAAERRRLDVVFATDLAMACLWPGDAAFDWLEPATH